MSAHFLLIHGAWHDHHCWDDLAALLRTAGHSVTAIDLPGHTPEEQRRLEKISLANYKNAVIRRIHDTNEPVHLVGHSMSGIILLAVASAIPEQIASLHFISAFIPEPGHSIFDETMKFTSEGLRPHLTPVPEENRFIINRTAAVAQLLYNELTPTERREQCVNKLIDQPLSPMGASVHWRVDQVALIKNIQVIFCEKDLCIALSEQKRMALHLPHCEKVFLPTDHSPELSAPKALAEILHSAI